jgi:hypothetical protein
MSFVDLQGTAIFGVGVGVIRGDGPVRPRRSLDCWD